KPRPGARRTIDFKAGLSVYPDERANVAVRDVIAVFSQSQLHCLGLASFLARTVRDKTGFVILDDPILSSDEDHRAHFIHDAVDKLMQRGCQVIILTQDNGSYKNLAERYAYKDIDVFQIILDDPKSGSTVQKTSDDLAVKLARVKPFIRSAHPDLRKQAA